MNMLSITEIPNQSKIAAAIAPDAPARFSRIAVATIALLLTIWVTATALKIENRYLRNHPYFFDPASYLLYSADLYKQTRNKDRFSAAANEFVSNNRMPLRTAPLLLLAPELLITPTGHMVTGVPFLLGFLYAFGNFVFRRVRSLLYAASCMVLFTALPVFLNPNLGLAAYWCDLVASLSAGTALIYLLSYIDECKLRYVALFALFASLSILTRYSAVGYLVIAALPLLVFAAIKQYRDGKSTYQCVLLPLFIMLTITAPLCGWFLVKHLAANSVYYTKVCYAINLTTKESFSWLCEAIHLPFGIKLEVAIALLAIVNALLAARSKSFNLGMFMSTLWWPVSQVVLLCVILKAVGGFMPMIYLLPAVFVFACAPVKLQTQRARSSTVVAIVLLAAGLWLNHSSYRASSWLARNANTYERAQKQHDVAIADHLASVGATTFAVFWAEHGAPIFLDCLHRHQKFVQPQPLFTIHEMYWHYWFPGKSSAEIAKEINRQTLQSVDVAIAFADSESVYQQPDFGSETTKVVATMISQELAHSRSWKKVAELSNESAKLAIYHNLNRLKAK